MEKDVEIGIFGGTGIYNSGLLENAQEVIILLQKNLLQGDLTLPEGLKKDSFVDD